MPRRPVSLKKKTTIKRAAKKLPSRPRVVTRRKRIRTVTRRLTRSTKSRVQPLSAASTLQAQAPRLSPQPTPIAVRSVVDTRPPQPVRQEAFVIPTGYGDHRIVLMVRDPWWVYAYWEIDPTRERQIRSGVPPEEIGGMQSILRVYDVTGRRFPDESANAFFDITLSGLANNWYIQVDAPGHEFIVDIGLLTQTGRFLLLARSNRVTTPRIGPSDQLDETLRAYLASSWSSAGLAGHRHR